MTKKMKAVMPEHPYWVLAGDVVREIAPGGIHLFDQIDFPLAGPVLDILLALNCPSRHLVALVIDKHLHIVLFSEAFCRFGPVLVNASNEIARNARRRACLAAG
jgi:hypothetical protein